MTHDKLIAELKEAQIDSDRWAEICDIPKSDTIARAVSELSRLRKVIDDAPHGQHCRAKHIGREYESGYCDCWKRAALEGK